MRNVIRNEHVTIDTNIDENLLIAAIKGDNEHVEILLNKGVNVNADTKSDDGSTVLIQASISGSVDLVKLLLDRGAKVNIKNKSGETALKLIESMEIDKLLKNTGAK